jgi:hypothetical protein
MRIICSILSGKSNRRDHLGDLGIDVRMILKYILQKQSLNVGLKVEFWII